MKGAKRAICVAIGESILPFSDMQTVLFKVSNLMNERPIGIKPGCDPELGSYLCPNDLLLGRASSTVPPGDFDCGIGEKKRLEFIGKVVDSFWKRWTRDYFQTLIVRSKWHSSSRMMKVGDVVMIRDSNMLRGQWRLGLVAKAHPGSDGRVRNVTVKYKSGDESKGGRGRSFIHVDRAVQNLVVILPVEEQ